jgi:deoxyribonuclease-4
MPLLGAHTSIAGGYYKAVVEAKRIGADVVQIFTKNASQWRAKPITAEEERLFAAALKTNRISHPISHASYLINLASPDAVLRQKSIESMVVELERADQLGVPYVIVHPGAGVTLCEEEALSAVAESLDEVHRRSATVRAQVVLEFTAGQGSCLGCTLAHLAQIVDQVRKRERIGICIDTCHAFAAGVDLRDRKKYLAFWREFDERLGLDRLKAIHLNDSKRELGSRVDRHEHIGRGMIGLDAFRHLLTDRRFRRVPMYLETKKGEHEGEAWDVINLRVLRGLTR